MTTASQQVFRRLESMVLRGRPRAALAAYRALTALDSIHREPTARIIELCRDSRPAVAAAAVKALVRARKAERDRFNGP